MALEATATLAGNKQPKPIPRDHRYDQDPCHFAILPWDLSQAFAGPKDFGGRGDFESKFDSKSLKRNDSKYSDISTISGSTLCSRTSKDSNFSTASGWDEAVLKKDLTPIDEESVSRRPSKGSFFKSLFTPPWRSHVAAAH
jgi:hypothetical protein